jgi:hypothetical protein
MHDGVGARVSYSTARQQSLVYVEWTSIGPKTSTKTNKKIEMNDLWRIIGGKHSDT